MPCSSIRLFLTALIIFTAFSAYADKEMVSSPVSEPPLIDGERDALWDKAENITVKDAIYNKDITLKSVHTNSHIYFLVSFNDDKENRSHRSQHWNSKLHRYVNGPEREDSFIFKWNMTPVRSGLTLSEEMPYTADIWFWKACRTDHAGYADDKIQLYSNIKTKNSLMLLSNNGNIFYLTRKGDSGEAAYRAALYAEKEGNVMPKFIHSVPTGSRADIRAKGRWKDGVWTIEFARKLLTGNLDDISLYKNKRHDFAVSITEIAGRKPEPDSENPMYGAGEVGELITILIK